MCSGSEDSTGCCDTSFLSHATSASKLPISLGMPILMSSSSAINVKASDLATWGQLPFIITLISPLRGWWICIDPCFQEMSQFSFCDNKPIGMIGSIAGEGDIIAPPGDIFNLTVLPSANATSTTGYKSTFSPSCLGRSGCVAPESTSPTSFPTLSLFILNVFIDFSC